MGLGQIWSRGSLTMVSHNWNASPKRRFDSPTTEMAPYYSTLPPLTPPLLTADQLSTLQAANTKKLEELEAALTAAQDTEGESEISDALRAKANYLARIGDKEKAVEAQKLAMEKTPGLGARIDIVLTLVRIGFFFNDQEVIKTYMKKAEA